MSWMRFLLLVSKFIFVLTEENWTASFKTGSSGKYSESNDRVVIKITGSNGTITKLIPDNHIFTRNSEYGFTLNGRIGVPYQITIEKPGSDLWELDYVKLNDGNSEYTFACDCMINGIPRPDRPLRVSRPIVSIMTICQNTNKPISCTGNDVINIIDSHYGRWDEFTCPSTDNTPCESVDVLEIFRRQCNGMTRCDLHTYSNKTCLNSYALVVFECIENWTITVKTGNWRNMVPRKDVNITINGSKDTIEGHKLAGEFTKGSVNCFALHRNIGKPKKITVHGNMADQRMMDFILFSKGQTHFIFNCYCMMDIDTIIDSTMIEIGNGFMNSIYVDVEYCFSNTPRSTSLSTSKTVPMMSSSTATSQPTTAVAEMTTKTVHAGTLPPLTAITTKTASTQTTSMVTSASATSTATKTMTAISTSAVETSLSMTTTAAPSTSMKTATSSTTILPSATSTDTTAMTAATLTTTISPSTTSTAKTSMTTATSTTTISPSTRKTAATSMTTATSTTTISPSTRKTAATSMTTATSTTTISPSTRKIIATSMTTATSTTTISPSTRKTAATSMTTATSTTTISPSTRKIIATSMTTATTSTTISPSTTSTATTTITIATSSTTISPSTTSTATTAMATATSLTTISPSMTSPATTTITTATSSTTISPSTTSTGTTAVTTATSTTTISPSMTSPATTAMTTATSTTTISPSKTSTASRSMTVAPSQSIEANESFCCRNLTDCQCFCTPLYYDDTGCLLYDVDCVVSTLRKQLIVDVQTTSSYNRMKTSAYDDRVSSQMIGASGAFLLVTAMLVIIVPDGIQLLKYICTTLKKNK